MRYVRFPKGSKWHYTGNTVQGIAYTACGLSVAREGCEYTSDDDPPADDEPICWNCKSGTQWQEWNPTARNYSNRVPTNVSLITINEWEYLGIRLGINYGARPQHHKPCRATHHVFAVIPWFPDEAVCVLCGLIHDTDTVRAA